MVCSNTMYSSIFYLSAFFVSTTSSIFFHCMNIFFLYVAFFILIAITLAILRKMLKKSFLKIADDENFKKIRECF